MERLRLSGRIALRLVCMALALLGGCGGRSRSGALLVPGSTTIAGTAATGAPIANATVQLKDRNGTLVSGTTNASGQYAIDVSGLTDPFLLKVTIPGGATTIFSVGTQAGIVDIHPLTDAIIRSYYLARGLDVSPVFATLAAASPVPTAGEVKIIAGMVRDVVGRWLADRGLQATGFDPLTAAFEANGQGFDAVLDALDTSQNGSVLTLRLSDGTLVQTSDVSAGAATITATTSATAAAGVSKSFQETLVPFAAQALAALNGSNATIEQLRLTANARGSTLIANDFAPFIAPGLLMDGMNDASQMADLATFLRGTTVEELRVGRIASFDGTTIDFEGYHVLSVPGGKSEERSEFTFKEVSGRWLFFGNRRLSNTLVFTPTQILDTKSGTSVMRVVSVGVSSPVGLLTTGASSVLVQGGPFADATDVPFNGVDSRVLKPTTFAADDVTLVQNAYFKNLSVAQFPLPGTPFQVTVTKAVGGGTEVYTLKSRGTTTETIQASMKIAGLPSPSHDVTDVRNQDLTVTWTLPKSYRVTRVDVQLRVEAGSNSLSIEPSPTPGSGDTTATLHVPPTVGGVTTTRATMEVIIEGPLGEQTQYVYVYD